jgi:hypothetical protein
VIWFYSNFIEYIMKSISLAVIKLIFRL